MQQDALLYEAQDDNQKQKVVACNQLESLLQEMRKLYNENNPKASQQEKDKLRYSYEHGFMWLEQDQNRFQKINVI